METNKRSTNFSQDDVWGRRATDRVPMHCAPFLAQLMTAHVQGVKNALQVTENYNGQQLSAVNDSYIFNRVF